MSNPHRHLHFFSLLSWAMSRLIRKWPLALIVVYFLSPVGPHLLWSYEYRSVYGERTYIRCAYLGSRGFFEPRYVDGCPVIAWLDSRRGRR